MHDVPYLRGSVGPEIVSGMTRICSEVKNEIGSMPMGVQILAGEFEYSWGSASTNSRIIITFTETFV